MCRKKMTLLKKRTRGLQPCQMRGGGGVGPPGWLSWSTAWPGGVSRGNAAELSWLCQVSLRHVGNGGGSDPPGGRGGVALYRKGRIAILALPPCWLQPSCTVLLDCISEAKAKHQPLVLYQILADS